MKIVSVLLAMIVLLTPAMAQAEKLKVVASFSILGDMVHQVAGDDADLKTLVGPDGDAHVYEPTPADAKAIAAADLVIINGLGFEGWLPRLLESSGYKGAVVTATAGISPLPFAREGMKNDPHAWQSLRNAKIYIANIRDALIKADADHAAAYKKNAARYMAQIGDLDRWSKAQIAKIPPEQRKIITSHDAFQYFAHDYGVEFIAPLGVSTESEASAAAIAKLIDQIRAQKIRTVFVENITDPRLIRQIEADSGATVGGMLYSDALSPPGGPASNYLAMFKSNVGALIAGMTNGAAPATAK
jgi:zinc/manganese transport system substrate-binding protein